MSLSPSVRFILTSQKNLLGAGGTRSRLVFFPVELQMSPSETAAVAPIGPAAHHSLVLCLVVSYALMTSD